MVAKIRLQLSGSEFVCVPLGFRVVLVLLKWLPNTQLMPFGYGLSILGTKRTIFGEQVIRFKFSVLSQIRSMSKFFCQTSV